METQKKFYLSCPLIIDNTDFRNIANSFNEKKFAYEGSLTYYIRGQKYSRTKLEDCDVFIIKHQDNKFNFDSSTLTEGCRKELKYAIDKGIPIILSYRTSYPLENRFYNVEIRDSSLKNEFIVRGRTGPISSVEEIRTHYIARTIKDKQETDAYFESKRRGEMWHDPVKPYEQTVESNNSNILLLLL